MNYTFSVPNGCKRLQNSCIRRISLKALNGKVGVLCYSHAYFVLQPCNIKSNALAMFSLPLFSSYARFLLSSILFQFAV